MKPVMLFVLVALLFTTVSASAVEPTGLDRALRIKEAELWLNLTAGLRRAKYIPKAQWCEHECSTYCMWAGDDCVIGCQAGGGSVEYCEVVCREYVRNCLCANNCCHPPFFPPEDDPCL